ncbi:MAG: 16S rRNA (guanine(527)-N(7))-methyltransferase RsmG [Armatimonadota bacterium]|nr:16S rRNA (guanine(527)-N(7))-methyltransferase RsmG [Armatimonadota bacterium]MDR5702025.1 16S rRNA (guanine(527)-N(7))-methyltransferase RsmG [Armatimonadota bacterium]
MLHADFRGEGDPLALLRRGAYELGISLLPDQEAQFQRYIELLLTWNPRLGLTAQTDPEEIVIHHFLDSLLVLKGTDFPSGSEVLDVGSGAGFPGVPLAIVRPDIQVILLEASRRRAAFLERLAWTLKVPFQVIWGRAEDIAHNLNWRERFPRVVSRAVAPLRVLLEFCLPFAEVGGIGVFLKGKRADEEIRGARRALQILGGGPPLSIPVALPFTDLVRVVVVVPKVTSTPTGYPRRPGIPSRRPL